AARPCVTRCGVCPTEAFPFSLQRRSCVMSRFCVVRWLQMIEHRFLRAPRQRQARAGLRPARFVPRLEALEDRVVPSTLTVTNNADSGAGSLRAQIAAANPGDTIDFAPYVHSITLTGGQLVIAKDLTIDGPGANRLTVSGNNASRVFDIGS